MSEPSSESSGRPPTAAAAAVDALPDDAVLVHVGMHKTGTTALQSMLAAGRDDLQAVGVHYPDRGESHHDQAKSLMGMGAGWLPAADVPPDPHAWRELAAEVRGEPGRVVLSSEYLSRARPVHIHRLVDDLGPERVCALVGVRNLAPVASSSWQQDLKVRKAPTLDGWLRENFQRIPGKGKFWDEQDPGATVDRWASVIGAGRLVVLVIDEADRSLLPATVEQLLGVPGGTLTGQPVARANRGMSAAEAELARQLNIASRDRLPWEDYQPLVRYGVIKHLTESRAPGPGEPKQTLPDWALRQAAEEGERVAEVITASGVRVIGDLANLSRYDDGLARTDDGLPPDVVPISVAVEAVMGTALATRGRKPRTPGAPSSNGRRGPALASMRTAATRDGTGSLRPVAARLWRSLPESARERLRAARRWR